MTLICTTKFSRSIADMRNLRFVRRFFVCSWLHKVVATSYYKGMENRKYALVEGGIVINTRLAEDSDETYPLFLDATAVKRHDDREERESRVDIILRHIQEANVGQDLELSIGFEQRGYGVYGMEAEFDWPNLPDDQAARIATNAMRRMATDLGTYADEMLPGMVYARVRRADGITLETNPVASSSMDTDGTEYRASSERVTLYAHNLYTHEMQLICISGLIALAGAGKEDPLQIRS